MKTKSILYSLFLLGGIIITSFVLYPTGSPGGRTGSPGDGNANCTGCHSGSAQEISNWISSTIPVSGYVPGQTYTITASAAHSGAALYGFEVTAEDASNAKKGTIIVTDAVQTQLANSGKSITHTVNGTTPSGDSKSWSFDWTAPASGSGLIRFYGAFNAANGNGQNTGDQIYLSSYSVTESSTGINDNLAEALDIRVYPNPFADYLELNFNGLERPVKSVMLIGQDGRMAWSAYIIPDSSEKLRIDAAGFSKGIYLLSVMFSDNSRASYKVVKN
jgi:hypothetical protein